MFVQGAKMELNKRKMTEQEIAFVEGQKALFEEYMSDKGFSMNSSPNEFRYAAFATQHRWEGWLASKGYGQPGGFSA